MRKIKIFGERNCGTNYLALLLKANIRCDVIEGSVPVKRGIMSNPVLFDTLFDIRYKRYLGWKHSFPNHNRISSRRDFPEILFLTITKNPYAWLLSLFRRPYHIKGDKPATFTGFLRQGWKTLKRENSPVPLFETPVDLWNSKGRAYIELRSTFPGNVYNLTYEELLKDPHGVIDLLADSYSLSHSEDYFSNIILSTKDEDKSYSHYREYYLEEKWRYELTNDAIEIINSRLDREVMEYFGYKTVLQDYSLRQSTIL